MDVYRVVRCIGSHIVETLDSQMAVRFSALRTDYPLLLRNIIFLLLVLISVRGCADHATPSIRKSWH
jgi:hypothetical protein